PLRISGPPSSSTPLPYTTLFRSLQHFGAHRRGIVPAVISRIPDRPIPPPLAVADPRPGRRRRRVRRSAVVRRRPGRREIPQHTRDRKSTRLNSSHQIISYAVFCL